MRKPAFCICENKDADQLRGTARFVSDLVGNPEDRFSHNDAHMQSNLYLCSLIGHKEEVHIGTSFK